MQTVIMFRFSGKLLKMYKNSSQNAAYNFWAFPEVAIGTKARLLAVYHRL